MGAPGRRRGAGGCEVEVRFEGRQRFTYAVEVRRSTKLQEMQRTG